MCLGRGGGGEAGNRISRCESKLNVDSDRIRVIILSGASPVLPALPVCDESTATTATQIIGL